ncbi:Hypothetical predicted protein [Xyrichtys novacula]|uniref:Uncharacterized protein n=1 Tax=Xyrichtys novacula TaxID=13765 RepID=A0AAV1FL59_XYRNO|nr:Hypothetical predicted protein [Xyrichtys novacula]
MTQKRVFESTRTHTPSTRYAQKARRRVETLFTAKSEEGGNSSVNQLRGEKSALLYWLASAATAEDDLDLETSISRKRSGPRLREDNDETHGARTETQGSRIRLRVDREEQEKALFPESFLPLRLHLPGERPASARLLICVALCTTGHPARNGHVVSEPTCLFFSSAEPVAFHLERFSLVGERPVSGEREERIRGSETTRPRSSYSASDAPRADGNRGSRGSSANRRRGATQSRLLPPPRDDGLCGYSPRPSRGGGTLPVEVEGDHKEEEEEDEGEEWVTEEREEQMEREVEEEGEHKEEKGEEDEEEIEEEDEGEEGVTEEREEQMEREGGEEEEEEEEEQRRTINKSGVEKTGAVRLRRRPRTCGRRVTADDRPTRTD